MNPWRDRLRCSPANGPICRWRIGRKCKGFGYDGLELACWGDHFEVEQALQEDDYCAKKRAAAGKEQPAGASPSATTWSARPCWTTSTPGTRRSCRPTSGATANPAGVNARAAEEMKDTARAAQKLGVGIVNGFTGSSIWHLLYSFPPVSAEMIDDGFKLLAERFNPILDVFGECGVKFALEVHPTEIAFDLYYGRAGPGGTGLTARSSASTSTPAT